MIFVLVSMLAVVAAAELVRMTCRRQLTAPLPAKPTRAETAADVQALPAVVGEQIAA